MAPTNPEAVSHDFEMINPADIDSTIRSITEGSHCSGRDDIRNPIPDKDIYRLFKKQHPNMIQVLAKFIILTTMPLLIYWSVIFAVSKSLIYSQPSSVPPDARIIECVSGKAQQAIESSRKRLEWVDEKLPSVINKHFEPVLKTMDSLPPDTMTQAERDEAPIVVVYATMGHLLLPLYCALPSSGWSAIVCFLFPIWLTIGCWWMRKPTPEEKSG